MSLAVVWMRVAGFNLGYCVRILLLVIYLTWVCVSWFEFTGVYDVVVIADSSLLVCM